MKLKTLSLFIGILTGVIIVFISPEKKPYTYTPIQKPEWCYFYFYKNKENFDDVKHPQHIFVIISGDKRIVFVKCNV